MKKIALIIALAALAVSCNDAQAPRHDAAATKLIKEFKALVAEGKYMYGHQDDLMYGKLWNVNNDGTMDFSRSDVLFTAGDFPAVVGFEIGEIELGGEYSLDQVKFEYIRQAALAHAKRGGVVTFSWHPNNPLTGGTAWDVSSNQVVASVLPGGEQHAKMMGWLKTVADFFSTFKGEDGKLVPIIWRPWHEHCGGWFWWGIKGLCTTDEYVALWKMTFDYMVGERGLTNLIWAISPDLRSEDDFVQVNASYPGDKYVDIIGFDCYGWHDWDAAKGTENYVERMMQTLPLIQRFSEEHDKLMALTETGVEGIPDAQWWTNGLAKAVEGYPILYALTWRNASDEAHAGHYYSPFPGEHSEVDFRDFAELPQTVFLNDLK